MRHASASAALPPRDSFINRRPMTRCASKPSITASFVTLIQFLNMLSPLDLAPDKDCLEGENCCARCLFQSLYATFCALQ